MSLDLLVSLAYIISLMPLLFARSSRLGPNRWNRLHAGMLFSGRAQHLHVNKQAENAECAHHHNVLHVVREWSTTNCVPVQPIFGRFCPCEAVKVIVIFVVIGGTQVRLLL